MEDPETLRAATLLDTIWKGENEDDNAAAFATLIRRRNELDRKARRAEQHVADAVTAMRTHGASWTTIAIALNVTKQAAQQRYTFMPEFFSTKPTSGSK